MKTLIVLASFLLVTALNSQSVVTLEPGTSMGVITGADLCANIINGLGILYGGGSVCGGLVAIDPASFNEIPVSFDMQQNYPNPFNPATVIKYQLPKTSYLSIKLYDQLGRETAILFEGSRQAGYYQAAFDGTSFASGIYFCRITARQEGTLAEGFTKVIKMSLIK